MKEMRIAPGTKVVVEQRLNGELRFRTGDRYLAVLSLPRPARHARRKPPEHQKPVAKSCCYNYL